MTVLVPSNCCDNQCSCGTNLVVSNATYVAKLSQTGLLNPVVNLLYNSYGFPVVWARTAVGTYTATFPVNLDTNKLVIPLFPDFNGTIYFDVVNDLTLEILVTNTVVTLYTYDTAALADDLLTNFTIEFRSY